MGKTFFLFYRLGWEGRVETEENLLPLAERTYPELGEN